LIRTDFSEGSSNIGLVGDASRASPFTGGSRAVVTSARTIVIAHKAISLINRDFILIPRVLVTVLIELILTNSSITKALNDKAIRCRVEANCLTRGTA
jgi:hypothetical protein